jgi:hypothetical protein
MLLFRLPALHPPPCFRIWWSEAATGSADGTTGHRTEVFAFGRCKPRTRFILSHNSRHLPLPALSLIRKEVNYSSLLHEILVDALSDWLSNIPTMDGLHSTSLLAVGSPEGVFSTTSLRWRCELFTATLTWSRRGKGTLPNTLTDDTHNGFAARDGTSEQESRLSSLVLFSNVRRKGWMSLSFSSLVLRTSSLEITHCSKYVVGGRCIGRGPARPPPKPKKANGKSEGRISLDIIRNLRV